MAASQVFDSNGSAQVSVTVGYATDKKYPIRCTAAARGLVRRQDRARRGLGGDPARPHRGAVPPRLRRILRSHHRRAAWPQPAGHLRGRATGRAPGAEDSAPPGAIGPGGCPRRKARADPGSPNLGVVSCTRPRHWAGCRHAEHSNLNGPQHNWSRANSHADRRECAPSLEAKADYTAWRSVPPSGYRLCTAC
jgi:hypothetical protein